MSETNSNAVDVIVQSVIDAVDKRLDGANFDKSQAGVVTAVNGNEYTIAVFGSQYTITSDQVFTVGQSVIVTALQGDMKHLVCSPDNVGTMKTVDSKVNTLGDKVDDFIGADFADTIIRFNDVKNQIDGSYIIWFENEEPSMNNSPAKDWSTDDAKKVHVGDLYYNKVESTAYKWVENTGSYSWDAITNKDIIKVFKAASQDNDTVDGMRRIFYGIPTTPYDKGDVWARAADNGLMLICQIGRRIDESYSRTDWVIASKYTYDFVADRAEDKADQANENLKNFKSEYDSDLKVTKESIEARVTRTDYLEGINGVNTRLGQAESKITQTADKIESKVWNDSLDGNKVVSSINQTADAVTISANKINLKGPVTTDSISAAGLNASVITAGKISAEHLDLNGDITMDSDGKIVIGENVITADNFNKGEVIKEIWVNENPNKAFKTQVASIAWRELAKYSGFIISFINSSVDTGTSTTRIRFPAVTNFIIPSTIGNSIYQKYAPSCFVPLSGFGLNNSNPSLADDEFKINSSSPLSAMRPLELTSEQLTDFNGNIFHYTNLFFYDAVVISFDGSVTKNTSSTIGGRNLNQYMIPYKIYGIR